MELDDDDEFGLDDIEFDDTELAAVLDTVEQQISSNSYNHHTTSSTSFPLPRPGQFQPQQPQQQRQQQVNRSNNFSNRNLAGNVNGNGSWKGKEKEKGQVSLFQSFHGNGNGHGLGLGGSSSPKVQTKNVVVKDPTLEHPNSPNKPIPTIPTSTLLQNATSHHPFNPATITSWIYPTNYPVRDYQFNIVQKALFVNTLVSLPTGLGKTLIAAVVMYNYYRWFPRGKIVFMAPTKPLVAQQIKACYDIMGIPNEDTVELTGSLSPDSRAQIWENKRIFYLTPQIIQNDLQRGTCPAESIVCLVVDEAHRAQGNHAYTEVVREMMKRNKDFRILALSATPGNDKKAVDAIIHNLLISRIEIRSEDSIDIRPYIHQRKVEEIVVKLDNTLNEIKNKFASIMEHFLVRLNSTRAYWERDPHRVSKFGLIKGRDKYRNEQSHSVTPGIHAQIEGDFGICIALAHCYSLLTQHGIRSFYKNVKHILDEAKSGRISRAKQEFIRQPKLQQIMASIESMMNEPTFVAHPKQEKLVGIVVSHFVQHEETESAKDPKERRQSRIMIFAQYRETVDEICQLLNQHEPIVRTMTFVGQATAKGAKGLKQKDQIEVIRKFQSGGYNTLVCTSIGEEGLDIGEVDLIVCYDSQNSSIRMLQRMGRTGRKREGRVCVLLTEGKEVESFKRSQFSYKDVQKAIIQQDKTFELYRENPMLLPRGYRPVCVKMEMSIAKINRNEGNGKRKRNEKLNGSGPYLDTEEYVQYTTKYRLGVDSLPTVSINRFPEWQQSFRTVYAIQHSSRSNQFVELNRISLDLKDQEDRNEDDYGNRMKNLLGDKSNKTTIKPPPKKKNKRKIVLDDSDSDGLPDISLIVQKPAQKQSVRITDPGKRNQSILADNEDDDDFELDDSASLVRQTVVSVVTPQISKEPSPPPSRSPSPIVVMEIDKPDTSPVMQSENNFFADGNKENVQSVEEQAPIETDAFSDIEDRFEPIIIDDNHVRSSPHSAVSESGSLDDEYDFWEGNVH
ncbi:hypothetical protein BKA69DRAFT_744589 [Paraphysoderma sedebokerense]|nr:hypothetical protein BKA69DRAFT_744589 [Paraphysoderma sedebokerense]